MAGMPNLTGLPSNFSYKEVGMTSNGNDTTQVSGTFNFVVPASVPGSDPLQFTSRQVQFERRLYKLEGIDVRWIGVVVPHEVYREPTPHIFFHPSAAQAGILDGDYAEMRGGWLGVYDSYSYWMGAQVSAAALAQHALVIPLYKSAQALNLGNFNSYWKGVVAALLTDAVLKKDPLAIRGDQVRFSKVCTSSFSLGIAVHKHFQARGAGINEMTDKLFDLDGKFGPGAWSFWSPSKGIIYQDRRVEGRNPDMNHYRLGQRWDNAFQRQSRTGRHRDTHWLTAQYMLYHGIMAHASR